MKSSVVFCQNAFYACRGAFGWLNEVWDKFWQFWQKFLTWVSIKLSTCPRESFEEENPSTNFYYLTFFRARSFSDFWRFLHPQGCQTCNLRDRRRFPMQWFFEKTSCLYNFSQSLSGLFLDFCPFLWQVCIQRAHRNIPRKNVFSNNNQISLWFLSQENEFWKAIRHVGQKLPPTHPEQHLEIRFLNMYLVA